MPLLEKVHYKDIVIYHYDEIESTSDLIRDFDNKGTKIVLWADTQTNGRGRKKRDWVSPLGGLWFTLSFAPKDFPQEFLPYVVRIPALAVSTVLIYHGISPSIKPPNDIYVENKKIAGILIDTKIKNERVERIYIGIGLNINNTTKILPLPIRSNVITMYDLFPKDYSIKEILFEILDGIFNGFDTLFKDKKDIDKLWDKIVIQ